jgi:hypothetical protein
MQRSLWKIVGMATSTVFIVIFIMAAGCIGTALASSASQFIPITQEIPLQTIDTACG